MNEKLTKLKELVAIQGKDGNWNYSPYMVGMYNGMELALATLEGRSPDYRDIPKKKSLFKRIIAKFKKPQVY